MRVLALADQPPPVDPLALARANDVEAVVTLGDLEEVALRPLEGADLPVLGVKGNHDEGYALPGLDLHLASAEVGGLVFAGFQGCVRYERDAPLQYTQREARRLVRKLPPADVLLTHCPPAGVNDEPGDRAHEGFEALRAWVERHRPRALLHGHTTPDPRHRVHTFGETRVVWVRGARVVEL
jgi:uncharacterized protein